MDTQSIIAISGIVGTVVAGLGGTWLGFRLSTTAERRQLEVRVERNWKGLVVATEHFVGFADEYLMAHIRSPLYRLPTKEYAAAYSALVLEDEKMAQQDAMALSGLLNLAGQLNRGLDQAAIALQGTDDDLMNVEANRIKLKAQELIEHVLFVIVGI